MAEENFVDMCAVCKQGVPKNSMVYQKGRVFHQQCFDTQGNSFPTIDPDLAQLSARTRVELVQMKNLKARADAGQLTTPKPKSKTKKKAAKKAKRKPSRSKSKKSKVKRNKKRAKRAKKSNRRTSKRRR